jgi:hypothetical protein
MKKHIIMALALLLTTTLVYAAPAKSPAAKTKMHVIAAAEVVKADTDAKKLTVKGSDNKETTMPCEGKAISELKMVKAGEKVNLTCRDNSKGEHEAVVNISIPKMENAAKSAKK